MTRAPLRLLGVVAAASILVVAAAPALAEEVADVIERVHASTYAANRLTVSIWAGETRVVRERVEHADGQEMVRTDETWSMKGGGRAITMSDAPSGIAFMMTPDPIETSRYEVGETTSVTHMRRDCTLIPILEDGAVRAHMVVDDRTGAPLITYIYDGDGSVFRTISLSDFAPHRMYEWPDDYEDVPVEIVMHHEANVVPNEAAGYELVDVFPGPAGSEQGFYSDGLFSFSLFAFKGEASVAGFEDPMAFVGSSGIYDMVPTAKDVRLTWTDGQRRYVLVGDLPPDHLDEVLADLPAQDSAGMFARWWRRVFG